MSSPLIAAKLRAPRPRAGLVDRDRLQDLIRHGAQSRLTLVSAPAGFGKSTLLAQWTAAESGELRNVAWVSLERSDNEPGAFWAHLVTAAAGAAGQTKSHPSLPAADLSPSRALTVALLNAVAALEGDLVLILDDFHVIEDPGLIEEFGFFLEHLSENAHIVISTRADPPLPLARLRARGELTEIRAADLRFRPHEAAEYFADTMHIDLGRGDIQKLEQRTEGWIAALQLAALSMRGRANASAFVDNFAGSDRYVVDYLVDEVLLGLPETSRQFLYATCMLDRFSADVCDAVLGTRSSRALIDMLEHQNLFVVALDDRRQWYRYHHLFADVLQAHMPEAERGQLPARHRSASLWFEQHGDLDEAIRHALAAKDFELAARLIERAIPEMRRRRRDAALRAYIEALPESLVRARPTLSVGLVGPLLQAGVTEGISTRLDEAEALLRSEGTTAIGSPMAAIELYRSALAQMRSDMTAAVQHAEKVFVLAPDDAYLERAGAAGFLAIVAWSNGDLPAAERHWAKCTEGLVQIGFAADAIGTLYARGQIAIARGRLDEAARLFKQGLEMAVATQGYPLPGSADLHLGLADVSFARRDLAAVEEQLTASEASELVGMPQYRSRKLILEARLVEAGGDLQGALALLDEAATAQVGDFFPVVAPIPAMQGRLNIRLGNWPTVERWQRDCGLTVETELSYPREYELITLARLLLARNDAPAALSLLARLLPFAESGGRQAVVIELIVLQALALRANGDRSAAQLTLRRALDSAEDQDQANPFLAEGSAIGPLLRELATGRAASTYARKLFAMLGVPQLLSPAEHPDLLEPLSDRELDVLRLLRGDMSGPDIASQLHVSLNTVRSHTKNIYEKLGVNSRRAAVRRAEEMDLLRREKSR